MQATTKIFKTEKTAVKISKLYFALKGGSDSTTKHGQYRFTMRKGYFTRYSQYATIMPVDGGFSLVFVNRYADPISEQNAADEFNKFIAESLLEILGNRKTIIRLGFSPLEFAGMRKEMVASATLRLPIMELSDDLEILTNGLRLLAAAVAKA